MEIRTIGVVGGGTMGHGIAQVAAQAGHAVLMAERAPELVQRALEAIGKSLQRGVEKGTIAAADKAATLSRISGVMDLERLSAADFVVEAVNEDLELKRRIFAELDRFCRPGVILASNTSSISITRIASATGRPADVIGMHFMNPVPIMKLVEVIRGHATADPTWEAVRALSEKWGKVPVEVHDYPGFISNRVLMPMINEAIYALWEGVATREAIDTVMKLGMNHPMGPLALADFIGLDTCLSILEILREGFGDPKYRPCPLLKKMVEAGSLGRKSGRGFYDYQRA
ncbi:MAG TPA: 3-hydroxybutyryl-CoA dehydrogenase [Candidatus Polarisedimenticolia bacterium]|jgi:3-hydroxybutyryl-CoA dehydrogenase|nr:3-hydroxybutyryl-CoA dehydrogenase [Candidatus Polarisedimenticolia bacterium]